MWPNGKGHILLIKFNYIKSNSGLLAYKYICFRQKTLVRLWLPHSRKGSGMCDFSEAMAQLWLDAHQWLIHSRDNRTQPKFAVQKSIFSTTKPLLSPLPPVWSLSKICPLYVMPCGRIQGYPNQFGAPPHRWWVWTYPGSLSHPLDVLPWQISLLWVKRYKHT